jgi:hypothetical protein
MCSLATRGTPDDVTEQGLHSRRRPTTRYLLDGTLVLCDHQRMPYSAGLVARLHVDLLRVASMVCRPI